MNNMCWQRLTVVAGFFICWTSMAAAAALTITNLDGLGFGSVVAARDSGTVTIHHNSSRTCSGGITCIPQDAGSAARFNVSGDAMSNYTITLPTSAKLSNSGGHSMTVDNFVDSKNGSGTLDGKGNGSFTVGAALHLSSGQARGNYSGAFEVLVEYQ